MVSILPQRQGIYCGHLFFFHYALQRMLVFASKVHDLRHLGLGYLVGVDSTLADAMLVHVHHDSLGSLVVLVEESLQHMHDELHGRIVVVQKQHPVEARTLGLGLGLGDDRGAWRPWSTPLVVVLVGQMRRRRRL